MVLVIAPVDAVFPQELFGFEMLVALVINDIRTVPHPEIHELPGVAVENEFGGMTDRHEFRYGRVQPNGSEKVVRRINADPQVGPKCLWRVVQPHGEDAGLP